MNKTQQALESIREAVDMGHKRIAPAFYTFMFGRAATSAAFRMAKQAGLIEVAYKSAAGTPVYKPGPAA